MSRALSRAPIAAAAACAGAFACFLVFAYGSDRAGVIDARVFAGFGNLATPGKAAVMDAIAHTADPLPLLVFLFALVGLGLHWGRRPALIAALAAVGAANVTTQILKIVLAHPRVQPQIGDGIGAVAFPSGHATASMSMAVALVLVAPRRLRPGAVLAGVGYGLAVCVSIIALGWHYPSDVFGGMLVATGFGFLALAGLKAAGHVSEVPAKSALRRVPPALEAGIAFAAAAIALLAVSRAEFLLAYARSHTTAAIVAFALAGLCAALLAAVSAAAQE